jgi:hypothetical protein
MMVGSNKNKWLPCQLDLLERLIDGGTSYEDAVPLVGHPLLGCRSKMSEIRSRRRDAERQKPGEVSAKSAALPYRSPIAKRPPAPIRPAIVPDPPHARTTSTAKLVMDAELRRRIDLVGVTAGLLGDPLPGRSALDRKREGSIP